MKRRIIASSTQSPPEVGTEVLLSSEMFDLVERKGIGRNNTPYTLKEVKSKGLAEKWIVEIRLSQKGFQQFEGTPVDYQYNGCYINYGLRGRIDTHIDEFIQVLQAAQDFKSQIDKMYGFKPHFAG